MRDQYHDDAREMFRRAEDRHAALLTTTLVLAEVHRFLLFRVGPRAAIQVLDHVAGHRRTTLEFPERRHHDRAREWLARLGDYRLSYTDAVSFAVMEMTRCEGALSFDQDFVVAGFRLWRPTTSRGSG